MSNPGHVTRTLLLPRLLPNTLIVSRGSNGNLDDEASDINSGHSQIKAFDISRFNSSAPNYDADAQPLDFNANGVLLGWGLRNSVGVADHPVTGGIWSVENSADNIERLGEDIHVDNPGEELNYHGIVSALDESLSVTDVSQNGNNHGYPSCFAARKVDALPENDNLTVGSQFVLEPTGDVNDRVCAEARVAPRLTFGAHYAPLDIKFSRHGSEAFMSFHGSWYA